MTRPTINDVARIAGVSKKTVSRVINQSPLLNPATRAKVEAVIAELGYAPDPQARALALRRNAGSAPSPEPELVEPARPVARGKLVALVHDASAAPFLAAIQEGVQAALAGSGHALAVCAPGADAEAGLRDFLQSHAPAGVLLLPPLAEQPALAQLCRDQGCAVAGLGAADPAGPAGLVASDDRSAAVQAVSYLISLGHERIGLVAGPDDSRIAQARELGYLDAMADHDLDRGPALIASGDNGFQSGYEAGLLLLEVSPHPTAIFAANDEMAAGVVHAAAQKGIPVPDGLSVIGFDDAAIAARLYPQLTTVRVPFAEMARAAAAMLIDGGESASAPPAYACELVVRGSTGPAG